MLTCTETISQLSLALPATTADPSTTTTCFSSWPLSSSGSVQNTSLRSKKGYMSTAGIFTHVFQPLLGTATADKAFKLINGILPDFVIDARGPRFSELLEFMDSSRLDGVETLADIKRLGIGESSCYVSFRAEQGQLKPIDRRAVNVHKEYFKATKDLDSKYHHTPDNEIGPVKSALCRSGLWRANTKARFSGSASAVSESCLLDSIALARS